MNIRERIWKYKFHYIIALPGLLLLLVFKVIPLLVQLRLTFVDYKFTSGVSGSRWAGWSNLGRLLENPQFTKTVSNTVSLRLEYVVLVSLVSFIVAFALSEIRVKWWRNILAAVFVVPFFIPDTVFAQVIMVIFSTGLSPLGHLSTPVLADPFLFRVILVASEAVKTCGVPIIAALGAIQYKLEDISALHGPRGRGQAGIKAAEGLKAIFAFALIQLTVLVSWPFDIHMSLINPLVHSDTVDYFIFKTGMMNMDFNTASAMWTVQYCVQFVLAVIAYLILRNLVKGSIFGRKADRLAVRNTAGESPAVGAGTVGKSILPDKGIIQGIAGSLTALIPAVFVFIPLYVLFIWPFTIQSKGGADFGAMFSGSEMAPSYMLYLILTLIAVIVNSIINLTMAFPLTSKDLPGKWLYRLLLIAVLCMGPSSFSEYILMRSLGLVDTFLPYVSSGFFSIISIFVLKEAFTSRYGSVKEKQAAPAIRESERFFRLYVPGVWKPLLALAVFQFVYIWNSIYTSLIYVARPNLYPPVLRVFEMLPSGRSGIMDMETFMPMVLKFGILVSIPSLLLFFALGRFLWSETFLSRMRR